MTEKLLAIKTPRLLMTAIFASLVASICCLGPFMLLATGLSGAWMSRVMAVEPYQPILVSVSLLLMLFAAWQLIVTRACKTHTECEIPSMKLTANSVSFILSLFLVMILVTSEFWIPLVAGV